MRTPERRRHRRRRLAGDTSAQRQNRAGTRAPFHRAHRTNAESNYLNADYGWKSWLLTTDHKRIAILYLISITRSSSSAASSPLLIRLELLTPEGDLVQADTYNKLFTMHGIIMVFFFLIPSIPAVLGNFLVPLMIGAQRPGVPAAQPAELVHLHHRRHRSRCGAIVAGGVDTGWTFYTPFSTTYSNTYVMRDGDRACSSPASRRSSPA